MRFRSVETKKYVDILLPARSLIIMREDARYSYTHEINKLTKKFIKSHGIDINTYCRISVTYRYKK